MTTFVDSYDTVIYRTSHEVEHKGRTTRLNVLINGSDITFRPDGDPELSSEITIPVRELLEMLATRQVKAS